MATTNMPIEVYEYDSNWIKEFILLREHLKNVLGNKLISVHHVGSTSVVGLAAKPILDIDIEISDYEIFPEIVRLLKGIGFIHYGNQGVEDREVFKTSEISSFMKCHVYVCPSYSKEMKRHIAFRDYLNTHENRKFQYAELKRKLAYKYKNNRNAYTEAKTEFILESYREIELT